MEKQREKGKSPQKCHIKADIERHTALHRTKQQHFNIREHDGNNHKTQKAVYGTGRIIEIDHVNEGEIKEKQHYQQYIRNHTPVYYCW
jgi:hypothetical protein